MQAGRQERGGLPRRRSRIERNLTFLLKLVLLFVVGAMALSLVGDMLDRIRTATAVVIGAIFFTYLVLPAVRLLGRRMPLGAAVAAVYLGIFVVLGFILSVVVPALLEDGKSLATAFPSIIHKAQAFVSDPNNQVLSRLAPPVRGYIVGLPSEVGALAQGIGGQVAAGALGLVLSAVGVLAMAVIIPVLSAYMMLEGES
ncbi:MAG TPA: AI-2E family transporter, partial [Candidatus Baltobacteraceae bacterium]|nr:AI-2E family transporter [Candidatus Baltobacteraceae bacterium]